MATNNDDLGQRLLPPDPRRSSAWNQPHPSPDQHQPDQQYPAYWAPSALAKSRLPVILVAVAVVLALAAGFAVWLGANRDTASTSGQSTPHAAVTGLLGSASRQDSVGAAGEIRRPAEREDSIATADHHQR